MAGEAEAEEAADRCSEADFEKAAKCARSHEAALAAEAVEVRRAQGAAAVLNGGQLARFDDLRQP